MRQVKGIVELHGDYIEYNKTKGGDYVKIEGVSTYDFQSVITSQTKSWKIDLISEICSEFNSKDINKICNTINELYSKDDLEQAWDSAISYNNALKRINMGVSNYPVPIQDSKEVYLKGKK